VRVILINRDGGVEERIVDRGTITGQSATLVVVDEFWGFDTGAELQDYSPEYYVLGDMNE